MKPEDIHLSDWKRLLLGEAPASFLLEVLLRTLVIYLVLIAVLRVFGKRMTGQLTILEMGVMITLGAIVSVPMQVPDRGVLPGVVLLVCVLAFQRALGRLGFERRRVELLTQGAVVPLVKDGVIQTDRLREVAISREQLYAALREKDVRQLGELRRVYLEGCGVFSVFKRAERGPGLSILPAKDEALRALSPRADGACACASCGLVTEGRAPERCPHCGAREHVAATL